MPSHIKYHEFSIGNTGNTVIGDEAFLLAAGVSQEDIDAKKAELVEMESKERFRANVQNRLGREQEQIEYLQDTVSLLFYVLAAHMRALNDANTANENRAYKTSFDASLGYPSFSDLNTWCESFLRDVEYDRTAFPAKSRTLRTTMENAIRTFNELANVIDEHSRPPENPSSGPGRNPESGPGRSGPGAGGPRGGSAGGGAGGGMGGASG